MPAIEKRLSGDGKTSFRCKVRLKGHPVVTETFERLTDARIWGQRTEAAIREGRHFGVVESKRHTAADMIERYEREILPAKRNRKAQATQLRWWKAKLGAYALSDVTPALIAKYRDELRREPIRRQGKRRTKDAPERYRTPATVVRYLAAIGHVFTIAMREWAWIDDTPMRRVTKPREARGRVRFLSDDERKALLIACKQSATPYLYLITVLALSTGMRLGEIMSLRWNCLDLDRGLAVLHETKNGDRRGVPLTGHVLDLLKELTQVEHEKTALLFPSAKNPNKPIEFRKGWNAALRAAAITDFRFHDLRHSAASYLAMSGATPSEMAEVLGHKTLAMVKKYAHLSDSHTRAVVSGMTSKIFSGEADARS